MYYRSKSVKFTNPVEVLNDSDFTVVILSMILDVVLFHVRADVFFHLLVFTDLELQGALQYNTRRLAAWKRLHVSIPVGQNVAAYVVTSQKNGHSLPLEDPLKSSQSFSLVTLRNMVTLCHTVWA